MTRRYLRTAVKMRNNRHGVSLRGWPLFRFMERLPETNARPPRHGNWRHGGYTPSSRQAMREVRAIGRLLSGRARELPAGLRRMPPPGWRAHQFLRVRVE